MQKALISLTPQVRSFDGYPNLPWRIIDYRERTGRAPNDGNFVLSELEGQVRPRIFRIEGRVIGTFPQLRVLVRGNRPIPRFYGQHNFEYTKVNATLSSSPFYHVPLLVLAFDQVGVGESLLIPI